VSDLYAIKAELRRSMRQRRAQFAAEAGAEASRAATDRALAILQPSPGDAIAAFLSLPGEIDTAPVIAAIAAAGGDVLLPRMVARGAPLAFHRWHPGQPLETASMGVRQPLPDSPRTDPSRLVVPLLAFDRRGYRLGYGGGFYDRTLARLRASGRVLAVGFAFDVQELPEVPHGRYDEALDVIVTETRTILVRPED
jgi:5-formyltetrahydrofolate cyclo-ligase